MKKCSVCGREYDGNKTGYGMCQKHYNQYRKYGKTLDNNPRSTKDPNEIVIYEDCAEIILYNKQCEEVARALIDINDIEKVKQYKWAIHNMGYVYNTTNDLFLHRLITNCDNNMVVDHINHNKLDNRESNLRICTQQQNVMNRSVSRDNTNGIAGIYWNKKNKKWCARIGLNRKNIYLGSFDTKEEAIEARRQAELEYFGEYRNQDED